KRQDTGFDAFLVEEKDTGKRVVVFRGTEPKQLADILSDLHPGGVGYNQLSANLDKVGTWINSNPGVTLTGHSLGGALTQFAAVKFPENVGEVITFNSPGLSGSQLTSTDYQHFKANNRDIQTTHYVVEKDAVSMAGNRFIPGDVYLLRQPDGGIPRSHGLAYNNIGRIGHPDISFTKLSTDELNDPEFAYSLWPAQTFGNTMLDILAFPAVHLLGRDRQTAEFTRTIIGVFTGTGLVHSR
ncbi:MAG: Mbeg1-like protein, partial [Crocosphaera sp.]